MPELNSCNVCKNCEKKKYAVGCMKADFPKTFLISVKESFGFDSSNMFELTRMSEFNHWKVNS